MENSDFTSIKIIDNVLPPPILKELQAVLTAENFPWFLADGVNFVKDGHRQFFHLFYANKTIVSEFTEFLIPFEKYLKMAATVRIKANLTWKTSTIVEHGFHCDFDIRCKTAIFYVNTNDGYTVFKSGEKVESVENRLVIFDSWNEHSGTTCTDKDYRIVINFNYFEEDFFRKSPRVL